MGHALTSCTAYVASYSDASWHASVSIVNCRSYSPLFIGSKETSLSAPLVAEQGGRPHGAVGLKSAGLQGKAGKDRSTCSSLRANEAGSPSSRPRRTGHQRRSREMVGNRLSMGHGTVCAEQVRLLRPRTASVNNLLARNIKWVNMLIVTRWGSLPEGHRRCMLPAAPACPGRLLRLRRQDLVQLAFASASPSARPTPKLGV
uniref:Uncharacterized protein n=1 Tax=Streptomyces hawaiiensis TaxID=67305 RepID=A0A5B9BIN2_9ACTN|nr:hypothetical protein [Streptomyces hawaiiensis]